MKTCIYAAGSNKRKCETGIRPIPLLQWRQIKVVLEACGFVSRSDTAISSGKVRRLKEKNQPEAEKQEQETAESLGFLWGSGAVAHANVVEFDAAARLFVHLVVGQRARQSIQETGALRPAFELAGIVDAPYEPVLGTAQS